MSHQPDPLRRITIRRDLVEKGETYDRLVCGHLVLAPSPFEDGREVLHRRCPACGDLARSEARLAAARTPTLFALE